MTVELIDSLQDEDLPDFLFRFAVAVFRDHGVDAPNRESLDRVPRGIRAAYSLVVLDSEVRNGGFYQWFTNSSGMLARETLDDLQVIGATRHIELIRKVLSLNDRIEAQYPEYRDRWSSECQSRESATDGGFWADVEANFIPEFDRLSSDFYTLESDESLWIPFVRYVRGHANECVHCRA